MNNNLIYIISENALLENNQNWIIDVFASEFIEYSGLIFTKDIDKANIIWIIGCYNLEQIKKINLLDKKPFVITTIHHIDWENSNPVLEAIQLLESVTDRYHVICDKVEQDLSTLTQKPIVKANFWINDKNFYQIDNLEQKELLREKYKIPNNKYVIGSFQRDTNGKSKCMLPKLSKGPDILINILKHMKTYTPNLFVVLTGRRRNYIINKLTKANIEYVYHEMVTVKELNEIYNCLDLYIVSSRVEGGPRSIMECGLAKVPIISTDVGIATLILNVDCIYDMNNYKTYKKAKTNIEYVYQQTNKYSIKNYMSSFIKTLFEL
jgi:hypothetical protein